MSNFVFRLAITFFHDIEPHLCLRVMLDPLVPKASKVSQVLKDPSVSPVKRAPSVLPENLVLLDALELVENVVTLEREALLESKDLKVLSWRLTQ